MIQRELVAGKGFSEQPRPKGTAFSQESEEHSGWLEYWSQTKQHFELWLPLQSKLLQVAYPL